jgi:acetolactate synthase-1/2/3 large subunit
MEGLSDVPIHPMRLCRELDSAISPDAFLVVDGHEILGFSRRGLTARRPGHILTPGVYGTMGVGVPLGIGAKVALSESPVVVLTGDGAFGYHAMELDTATRHNLGIVFVISNNGGWTGARGRAGFALEFSDYERLADVFHVWGTKVTEPADLPNALGEALQYAEQEQRPAIVNVVTSTAQSGGREFVAYSHI